MKLLPSFVFGSTIASHFRGATWLTEVNDNGDLELTFPQTWRRGMSGFWGKHHTICDIWYVTYHMQYAIWFNFLSVILNINFIFKMTVTKSNKPLERGQMIWEQSSANTCQVARVDKPLWNIKLRLLTVIQAMVIAMVLVHTCFHQLPVLPSN